MSWVYRPRALWRKGIPGAQTPLDDRTCCRAEPGIIRSIIALSLHPWPRARTCPVVVGIARYHDFNAKIVIEPPLTEASELLPGWRTINVE